MPRDKSQERVMLIIEARRMDRENKIDLVEKLMRYFFERHNSTLIMNWNNAADIIVRGLETAEHDEKFSYERKQTLAMMAKALRSD